MRAEIKAISYYLPEKVLSNEVLSLENPTWDVKKIEKKIGIQSRRIASSDEFSLEMGILVANKFFEEHKIDKNEIDFLLFCTQTPKYTIPANACILQEKLGLGKFVGAMDLNQGCSGYPYSLMMAESLITSGKAKNVLLITSDTYTKTINKDNYSLRMLLGDAATATLISLTNNLEKGLSFFEYGTDGSGSNKLISYNTGLSGLSAGEKYSPDLCMDGAAVFSFVMETVPNLMEATFKKANLSEREIDFFVFHQANRYMLESLREKLSIDENKFIIYMNDVGNTGSSSIPIVMKNAIDSKKIIPSSLVMLAAFGVGFSWCSCLHQY